MSAQGPRIAVVALSTARRWRRTPTTCRAGGSAMASPRSPRPSPATSRRWWSTSAPITCERWPASLPASPSSNPPPATATGGRPRGLPRPARARGRPRPVPGCVRHRHRTRPAPEARPRVRAVHCGPVRIAVSGPPHPHRHQLRRPPPADGGSHRGARPGCRRFPAPRAPGWRTRAGHRLRRHLPRPAVPDPGRP